MFWHPNTGLIQPSPVIWQPFNSGAHHMKVTVYFEAKAGAHIVAQFDEESTYMACLPALEELAKKDGYTVTETVDYED